MTTGKVWATGMRLGGRRRPVGRESGEKHMFNGKGRLGLATLACVGLTIAISNTPAAAWKRGSVQTFAEMPPGMPTIEGLTVDRNGNVYVSTFNPAGSGNSRLLTFNPQGKLL